VHGGEISDQGLEGLENLELDVGVLRYVVVHRLDDSWDGGDGDGAEGDEGSERAEGDRDHFVEFWMNTG